MNVSMLVAIVERQHVGFIIGFELMPSTYFCWLCGVVPDFRRAGIATQLMQGQQAWARDHDYALMRFECQNQHRPMMHAAITRADLVGIRWHALPQQYGHLRESCRRTGPAGPHGPAPRVNVRRAVLTVSNVDRCGVHLQDTGGAPIFSRHDSAPLACSWPWPFCVRA
jgi:hypothetical protein